MALPRERQEPLEIIVDPGLCLFMLIMLRLADADGVRVGGTTQAPSPRGTPHGRNLGQKGWHLWMGEAFTTSSSAC